MQPTSDPLQHWLDRLRAGADPSPDELCRLCEARVRALVRPRLRTFPLVVQDSQTTDVTNETILRLLSALRGDVRPRSTLDLERFMASKVRHVLLDMHKMIQRRRRQTGPLGEAEFVLPAAEDAGVDIDLMVAFHEYVQQLPADEQALFDVFYYQGRTKTQAAALLGMTPTTAHTRWTKARLRLSRTLGRAPTELSEIPRPGVSGRRSPG